MLSQPNIGTIPLDYSNQLLIDLFTKLNDDLTGKLSGFEAMRDHLISAATKINLAYGPNNSECMLAVQHFHPVS